MCRAVAGSVCRWGTRRGACPAGRRLTVPFRNPQGGLPFWLPAAPAFTFFPAPIPRPPSPPGKGETISLFCRGLRPRHPGIRPFATRTAPAMQVPGGGLPSASPVRRKTDRIAFPWAVPAAKERGDRGRWNYPSQATAAFEMVLSPGVGIASAAGGRALLAACCPLPLPSFLPPIPPTPFPAGRGRFLVFLCKGLRPLHPWG